MLRTASCPAILAGPIAVRSTQFGGVLRTEVFAAAQALLGTQGVVDLALTCSYYTAVCLAQLVLKPDMDGGRVSTLSSTPP